ncbi:type VII secretion integral membrane protein EccD [Arthrobacter flavus]|uniref:Type VII secretion integral membrane protein EccD n=1 Tax=Arthrobacter flavus TaxID=95172 RepID=A0ABW4Q8Q8_9MICC
MSHAFTRVTLVGAQRHIDLLLPSHQPVGALMPQVLELLEDAPQRDVAVKQLVTPDGTALDAAASLSQSAVTDGTALLLCSESDVPPAAVVYDVTDLVVDQTEEVTGRWTIRFRDITAGAFAALGLWAGVAILLGSFAPGSAWWILISGGLLLTGLGAALGRPPRKSALGPALLVAGWVLGLAGILEYGSGLAITGLLVAALSIANLLGLGAVSARPRALFAGAATLGAATGIWGAAALVGDDPAPAAALAGIASVLLLGLLPALALSASGLSTLDDQRAKGGTLRRTAALSAVNAAHRSLSLATVFTAASIALALAWLGTDTQTQVWTLPLLLALTLATFLRARSFPLALERIALYLASLVGLAALAVGSLRFLPESPWLVGLAALAVAAVALIVLTFTPADHTAARFRQLANRAESLAILATIPLAAGLFGIFAQLLESFS